MKQIIAIIRDERTEETKKALETIGVRGITFLYVTGRGEQKGRISIREPGGSLARNRRLPISRVFPEEGTANVHPEAEGILPGPDTEVALGFLPKRMLVMVSDDEEVDRIIQAVVNANRSGQHGDGRIFICPMISAIRVRTGEQGDKALS
jgi:nitrogen regulatory protein PII 2